MKKRISILGSTGSIGRQALEVIEKLSDKFEIIALSGGSNSDLLNEQIKRFRPKYAYSSCPEKIIGAKYLSLDEICSNKENDIILMACSGKMRGWRKVWLSPRSWSAVTPCRMRSWFRWHLPA